MPAEDEDDDDANYSDNSEEDENVNENSIIQPPNSEAWTLTSN